MASTEHTGPQLWQLAALLADETRARCCLALLDGRAWTAGELARSVGVTAATASSHLSRLSEGGLLQEYRTGRHRYLRLAGPEQAQLVEDLLMARCSADRQFGGQRRSGRTCDVAPAVGGQPLRSGLRRGPGAGRRIPIGRGRVGNPGWRARCRGSRLGVVRRRSPTGPGR